MTTATRPRIGWPTYAGVLLILAAIAAGILRFAWGLGRATNMNDSAPWGIWVIVDDCVGIALAVGGFTIVTVVAVAGIERYRPLLRPAILTALLGYMMVIVSLIFDLGRPWNIWRVIPTWQPSSVMWGVGWSVIILTLLLLVMFSPVIFDRLGWRGAARAIAGGFGFLAFIGAIFAVLHQTALGALFLMMPDSLHPFWYSPMLPAYFFVSALGAGAGMIILESRLSARFLGHRVDDGLLAGLARPAGFLLAAYLVFRLGDVLGRGAFDGVGDEIPRLASFLVEMVIFVAVPAALFMLPAVRRSPRWLTLAAALAVGGVFVNRINVGIVGMANPEDYAYYPNWLELLLTIGVTAGGIVVFSLVARFMPLFTGTGRMPAGLVRR